MKMFGKMFWIISGITFILIIFILFLPLLLTQPGNKIFDFRETGQIGDTIGGTMSPFVAIIAAILTFLAFWVQYVANQQQREDISLERFENRLFQMIAVHEELTNNLTLSSCRRQEDEENPISGRKVFEYIYLYRTYKWHTGLRGTIEAEGIDGIKDDKSLWILDHYFRHLYRMIKIIDEAPVLKSKDKSLKKKYEYVSIVRSSLSNFELIMLYYNVLGHNNDQKFKKLIERYALLNNLRFEHLALAQEKNYYYSILSDVNNNLEKPEHPDKFFLKSAFLFEDGKRTY